MKTGLTFLAAMAVGTVLTVSTAVFGGPSCAQATAEVREAQTVLSKAMRTCDANAGAYGACMQKSRNNRRACVPQKRKLDGSLHHRRKAQLAFSFAQGRARHACRVR